MANRLMHLTAFVLCQFLLMLLTPLAMVMAAINSLFRQIQRELEQVGDQIASVEHLSSERLLDLPHRCDVRLDDRRAQGGHGLAGAPPPGGWNFGGRRRKVNVLMGIFVVRDYGGAKSRSPASIPWARLR